MAKNPYEGLAVPVEDENPYAGLAVPVDDAQQPQMGFWEHLGKAGQFGAAVAAANYGKTLKQVPDNSYTGSKAGELGQALENTGSAMLPKDYQPSNFTVGDLFNKNKTWGDVGSSLGWKLAESAPGLAASGIVGAGTGGAGFVGSEFAQHYGENAEARQAANGGKPLNWKDYAGLAGTTALEAYLSKAGLGRATGGLEAAGVPSILGSTARAVGNTARATGENAAAGVASDISNQEGRNAFNGQNPNGLAPLDTTELANAGIQGGAAGGLLRAARVPGDTIQDVRFSKTFGSNPEVAKGLANDILSAPVAPTSNKTAFQNLNLVEAGINRDIGNAQKASADHFAQNPQSADLVAAAQDQIKQGIPLKPEQVSALNDSLGSTEAPGQLNFNLQKANQLLKLKKMGNWDPEAGTFSGGAADSTYGKMTNPLGILSGLAAKGAHGNIGALGAIAAAGELSGHGIVGHLPAIVGTLLAARTGLHALDYLTGYKNPTQNFANRFAGEGGNAPTITPPPPPPEMQGTGVLSNADMAQIAMNKMAAQKALADQKSMWQAHGPAMQDDAAFNKANDANIPAPTVPQLAQQAAMRQKAMEIAQAQAQAQAQEPARQMQAWMGQKGSPNGLPEAQGFQASAPPPPEVHGQGVLSKAALTQIAMNKLNPPKPWTTPQISEMAQQPVAIDPRAAAQAQANFDKALAARQPDFGASKTVAALKALQKLSGKPEKAAQAAPQAQGSPQAANGPAPSTETPKVNGEAPGASQEAPKDTSIPTISVTYRGHTVTRPAADIKNEYAYKAGIQKNIAPRADLADDLKASLGKSQVGNVNHLIDLINNHSKTSADAEGHMLEFLNTVPETAQKRTADIMDNHIRAIRRTFGE